MDENVSSHIILIEIGELLLSALGYESILKAGLT